MSQKQKELYQQFLYEQYKKEWPNGYQTTPYSPELLGLLDTIKSQEPDPDRVGTKARFNGEEMPYEEVHKMGTDVMVDAIMDPRQWWRLNNNPEKNFPRNELPFVFAINPDETINRFFKAKKEMGADGLLSEYIKDIGY